MIFQIERFNKYPAEWMKQLLSWNGTLSWNFRSFATKSRFYNRAERKIELSYNASRHRKALDFPIARLEADVFKILKEDNFWSTPITVNKDTFGCSCYQKCIIHASFLTELVALWLLTLTQSYCAPPKQGFKPRERKIWSPGNRRSAAAEKQRQSTPRMNSLMTAADNPA